MSRASGHGQPARRRSADRRDGVGEQRPGTGRGGGRRRGPRRRRARRRPSPAARASAARTRGRRRHGALAHPLLGRPSGGGAEGPDARPQQSSTPRRPCQRPSAERRLRNVPVDALGVDEEAVRRPAELGGDASGPRLRATATSDPGHVVGAVALAAAGLDVVGVLERADVVAHGDEVVERRPGRDHAVTACVDGASSDCRPARRTGRRCRPRQVGGKPAASAAMLSARSGSVDHAADGLGERRGSRCGTTMPAPLPSSSTACGKAVAMTGRPAATASTSTPDVTWSSES